MHAVMGVAPVRLIPQPIPDIVGVTMTLITLLTVMCVLALALVMMDVRGMGPFTAGRSRLLVK
jgi:hypothetical protein